jgi:hypothetical protein
VSTKTYGEQCGSVRKAYRAGHEIVLEPGCSLPDICVGCGSPAFGNIVKREFEPVGWWLLPTPFDFLRLWFGTHYVFAFPFCPVCALEQFQLKPVRLDSRLAVFSGGPQRLFDALPSMPAGTQKEKERSWLRRTFR